MKEYWIKVTAKQASRLRKLAEENGFRCFCDSLSSHGGVFFIDQDDRSYRLWYDDSHCEVWDRLKYKKDSEKIHKILTKKPRESKNIMIGDHKVKIKKKAKYGFNAVKIGCETLDKQFIKRLYELTAHSEFDEFIEKLPKIAKKLKIPKNEPMSCCRVPDLPPFPFFSCG